MKPAPFTYHAPETVADAVALLAQTAEEDGRILAGGQSLAPAMAFRLARPGHLIDINRIAALQEIRTEGDALVIGAGVRHAAFHQPVCDGPTGALLSYVVRHIAHLPIRTRGTFCGSLAHADPSSEWCVAAATLGATMVAESTRGARDIPAAEFFDWAMTTNLEDDELLTAVRLPVLPATAGFGFHEFARRAGDYAIAMALAVLDIRDGEVVHAHIGLGGVEPFARRFADAEALLIGGPATDERIHAAADAAAEVADAMDDNQGSADYRRDLARGLLRRALADAVEMATESAA